MDQCTGLSAGIVLATLLIAAACAGVGLVLSGAIGYAIGRSQAARTAPPIEGPRSQPPSEE